MSNPNPSIRIKRAVTETGRFSISTGAPSTLNQGELAVIFPNPDSDTPSSLGETIYVGNASGSAVAVGGSGTFATRQYVDDKVTSVFVYKGKITSFFPLGSATFPLNLDSTLSQVTGAYYSIDSDYPGNPENDDPGVVGTDKNAVAISWTEGSTSKTLLVKLGDSIVKTDIGWEKFDNVDVEVRDTADETKVTGDENTGYTVGLATTFKNRVSDLEAKTQNIDATTAAGSTFFNGNFAVRGNDADNAFSVTSSGEVSIGAPGADIYLDRPTYAEKSLDVKGKLTVDVGTNPDAVSEFVIKDIYSSEMVNINGGTAKITLGDEANPSTEVTVARKLGMASGGYETWEFKSDGSAKNYATEGAALGSSFEVSASGEVYLGTPWLGKVSVRSSKLVGVDGNFGTPSIENFIIDAGTF